MLAFVMSRALGLVREMTISRQFGTSGELDAYLAAFRIPDFIFQLVAGGALGSAFIPIFTGYLARGDEKGAWQVASSIFNIAGSILILCAAIAALIAPQLITYVVAPGFNLEEQALSAQLMRLMLISPAIFGLSGIVMSILNSYQHFLLPALAPVVYNLSIIIGALLLAPVIGIHGLAVGVVAGAVLHLAIQIPGLLKKGMTYSPILGLGHPGVREVGRLMLPRALGLAVVQINFLVNTILASRLAEGSLAALNYAWMLMMLPQGIFAIAIGTAAFPTFSELAVKEELEDLRETFTSILRLVLYLSIPTSVGMVILKEPLISLLLERGRFTALSTEATAWALQFYVWALFAYAAIEIIARTFYSLHDTKTPVLIGGATLGLNIVLSLALVRPLRHGGLALANALATTIEMIGLLLALRWRLKEIEMGRLLASTLRIALAAGLMGLAVMGFLRVTAPSQPIISAGGGILLGASVYFLLSLLLGSEESTLIQRLVRERVVSGASGNRDEG